MTNTFYYAFTILIMFDVFNYCRHRHRQPTAYDGSFLGMEGFVGSLARGNGKERVAGLGGEDMKVLHTF